MNEVFLHLKFNTDNKLFEKVEAAKQKAEELRKALHEVEVELMQTETEVKEENK